MRLGMPTLIETKSLDDCVRLCRELGLSWIELNMNLPQYQIRNMDPAGFRALVKGSGIGYTLHLDENLNPCDFNQEVAGAYLRTAVQAIEAAQFLEIPILNMHLSEGVYFTLPEGRAYLFDIYEDLYLESLAAFRKACEKSIAGSGIRICIENTNGFHKSFLPKGLGFLLESPVFGLTLDIGHLWSMGGGDWEWIMRHEDKLLHMHMHDAVGAKDHLALGTGEIPLDFYLALAQKYDCRIILETKTIQALKESVTYLRARS